MHFPHLSTTTSPTTPSQVFVQPLQAFHNSIFSPMQWIASGNGDCLVSAANPVEEEKGVDSQSSDNLQNMEEHVHHLLRTDNLRQKTVTLTPAQVCITQYSHTVYIGMVIHLLSKKRNSLTKEPMNHVNWFSSDLVHRHIIFLVLLTIITGTRGH